MQIDLKTSKIYFMCVKNIEDMLDLKSKQPFSEDVCLFLNEVSKVLIKDKNAKLYPDVITFAYFIRKSNLENLKLHYSNRIDDKLGKGLIFHIAPSNVPINFAYTLVAGLLSGCASVVKTSSKDFEQTKIICEAFRKVTEYDKYKEIGKYITVISYDRENNLTKELSKICDIRVIWGGDNTINEIRKNELSPRAFDVTFANRYSICVINAVNYLNCDSEKVVKDFYNDTYLYDQNACSSPHLIYWVGKKSDIEKSSKKFWDSLYDFIKDKYEIKPIVAMDKLMTSCRFSINKDNIDIINYGNFINIVNIDKLENDLIEYSCAGGSFVQYKSESIEELKNIVDNKYQTMSYLGIKSEELKQFVIDNGLKGIDRIVPIGKTVDFNLVWDGYDLIEVFSRKVNVL